MGERGDLVERLWASDEASALTNAAAREIEKLRAVLRERDGGIHDQGCRALRYAPRFCNCGHNAAAAALGEEP